jgi:hypothetical protein
MTVLGRPTPYAADARSFDRIRRSGHGLPRSRDNLIARIAEAEREGWLGEVEALRVSLAGGQDKLDQFDAEAAHGPWDDQLVFLFDAGALTSSRAASIERFWFSPLRHPRRRRSGENQVRRSG